MDSLMITPKDLELDFDVNELPSVDEMITLVEAYTGKAITSQKIIARTSSPLNARDTLYSQKISIRVPRYILDHFRAESIRTGIGYQTLINVQLNEIFSNPKT